MNKKEIRHQLIRSLVLENRISTQVELQQALRDHGIKVTQATLSRDIKDLNLVKISSDEDSQYVIHSFTKIKWEERLRFHMEDALINILPVQHQVVIKTMPGVAQSFGAILDGIMFPEAIATICGDDTCLIICKDNEHALLCFDRLKQYAPPHFFE
ncbi:arginine repressor [Granulicatella sp. zg-ZJ]|uniref:arginine repressor n=1 Tax=unclassified Granulicatella TaxID=2630493 RepID=UPI0013C276C0|nr:MULTISPECIES: arginine repressor [unclassified Granulicatella]MBS4751147.1 arginine repressor [Carnobacteriaceae bacterium zg-ZUI78]NEW63257.1 arginine repressor [Granulicatella sp. zg-ZJ]NEW66338.1 arginine repressor [Granulicatella sp. zg-84]QMI85403.1 arginine repressor [Carnobacteriaceae bacterium zg-84]